MEMLSKVGSYAFLAEPFHCDFSHRLFLGHLGNHMLNAADFHSNDRGYGMSYLNPLHKTWVLSRLAIEMNEMPQAYERFTIDTWVDSVMRFFTSRNFRVSVGGTVCGYGKSIWAMIDTDSRQPVDILAVRDGLIKQYIETETACPIDKSSRVKMGEAARQIGSIATNYSDVDINGHVNSVKYIEHVLDLWPLDWYRRHRVKRFEIAYVAESHCGDVLNFYREEIAENEYGIKITKSNGNAPEEIEVVRCRVDFEEY